MMDSLGQWERQAATTPTPAMRMARRTLVRVLTLVAVCVLVSACAASRSAFRRAEAASRVGDWDTAVDEFRKAVQLDPNRTEFQIALERAMISASLLHLEQARIFEAKLQLEDSLREYRRASEYDPPNRTTAAKVIEIERRIRDLNEANRPRTTAQQLRDAARNAGPPPLFNLTTVLPAIRFTQTSLRDILNTIGTAAGINVTYDRDYQDRAYTVQLDGVTLEEALNQVVTANQLFFKVVNPKTIMIIPDTGPKRAQYEEQVIRTFFINHADATEVAQILNTVIRVGGGQVQPVVVANKTANTITIRATSNVAQIIEKIIDANDNPRAEIVVDVQILEVSRSRTKEFGIELSSYTIPAVFSPEVDPRGTTSGGNGGTDTATLTSRPFNLNTITRGINTADFYLAVPSAVVHFLESDTQTKVVAKPQLRGAEGTKLTLNLGEEIPVPSTTFTPVAQGGANFNPLTSFTYRPVGVIVEMTPRVTVDGDIIMDLLVESSALGSGVTIAGQDLPSFVSRKVITKLRLREGESSLLAGLLRENERRSLSGLPGLIRLPIIKQLFANNERQIDQTDIVMLLTPRIVRTQELTSQDLSPIYIGTQQNLGLGGPPPLIAPAPEPTPAAAAPAGPAPAAGQPVQPAGPAAAPGQPPTGVPVVPPGSSTIPGTTILPAPPPAPQQAQPPFPADPNGPPAVQQPPPAPAPAPTPPPPAAAGSAAAPGPASGGQIVVSPPGTEFRVGGGPYTVPISVTGASRLSGASITLTFNPATLRVRTVQEGSFMRSGGIAAPFTQQVDGAAGRIDIAIVRTGDSTGVAGTGLLAAVLFDAVAPGPANLTVTGSASAPGGAPLGVVFSPVPMVTVR